MKPLKLSSPQLGWLALTRAMLGGGFNSLFVRKVPKEAQSTIGWTLTAAGVLTTFAQRNQAKLNREIVTAQEQLEVFSKEVDAFCAELNALLRLLVQQLALAQSSQRELGEECRELERNLQFKCMELESLTNEREALKKANGNLGAELSAAEKLIKSLSGNDALLHG